MISACVFDLEGVILDMDQLPVGTEPAFTQDDLKDGVFIFIKELKNKGLNLAAVSAGPNLRQVLNRLQITHYFHTIVDVGVVPGGKHTVEAYQRAARELGVSEEQTLVFTGTADGVEAASEAGCWVVGVGVSPELGEADLMLPSFEKVRFLRILAAIGEG